MTRAHGGEKNMDSILDTIKQMLGVTGSDFDVDILVNINTALSKLRQLGVGPLSGFVVTGNFELWENFVDKTDPRFSMVQLYVYYSTKLVFDPPTNSSVLSSIKETIRELECRIQYEEDSGHKTT